MQNGEDHFKSVSPNCIILNALGGCPRVQQHSAGPELLCLLERLHCDPMPAPLIQGTRGPCVSHVGWLALAYGWQCEAFTAAVRSGRQTCSPGEGSLAKQA